MSTHPNTLLIAVFTPDDLARKTHRNIVDQYKYSDSEINGGDLRIPRIQEDDNKRFNDARFCSFIMENDESGEDIQIDAPIGSIVVHKFLTYGYYEKIAWEDAYRNYCALRDWALLVDKQHKCSHEIYISANYW